MTDFIALAVRCEEATGPDEALDLAVFMALRPDVHPGIAVIAARSRCYSTSLDAAITAVPEGWAIERWSIWPGQPSTLTLNETRQSRAGERYRSGGEATVEAKAATPALALTAACLRARSLAEQGGAL